MSELKAVHAFDVYEAYTKTGDDDAAQVYLKSEADKVIAEKDAVIAKLKDAEHVGHRMKGEHTQNHIYNKCHKYVFRGKNARKIDRNDKKEFVRIFYIGLKLNRNFGEFLHKIFHKNNNSTAL